MKKLFTLLVLVFLVSCNTKSVYKSTNSSLNFAVSSKKVYHKGIEIGYLDSIKLEKEGNKIKHEYSFILFKTPKNYELAPLFLEYLTKDGRFKGVDLEVKFIN